MDNELAALRASVDDLQTQVAFQEDSISTLNAAIASQQQDLLVMRRQLQLLQQQLQELPPRDADGEPQQQRPPHY